jgi:excisionase family DNA binding protein
MSRLLTVKELADLLHVHPKTVYRWKQNGKLPFLTKNGLIRFKRENIEEWIEKDSFKPVQIPALPSVDFSLEKYDKLMLKGGKSALGKNLRRWNYGIGSIYLRKTKKGKDRWCIDFKDSEGKRKREVIKDAQGRGEALLALQAKVAQIFNGKFNPKRKSEPLKFNVLADIYLEDYAKVKKRSWRTDKAYIEKSMKPAFKDKLITEITPLDIEKFIKRRLDEKVSKTTVNRGLQILKRMFNLAIDWGYIFENPSRKVKLFSEKDNLKERILSHEEEARLLETSPEHLRPIIIVALNSGMRRGEILGLRWTHLDFEKRTLKVERSKSGRPRFIDMNHTLFELLRELRMKNPGSDYIFSNPQTGKPFVEIGKAFRTACRRSGVKGMRFHDLRHTFASRLIEAGTDIITVRDLLGHSSVKLTERYTHSKNELKRRAVESLENGKNLAQIWHTEEKEKSKTSASRLFSMN